MRLLLALLFVSLWFPDVRAQEPRLLCAEGDKPCAREALKNHPARKPAFWRAALAKPVDQRIGAAPAELIEVLALDNIAQGYPNKPRAPRLTPEFLADARRALNGIPAAVKRRLADKLAGIYFADDIGGTGFTDEIDDPSGKPKLGFIVLDPSVLMEHKANGWATWKDNTPFKPGAGWQLAERIEDGANDNRSNAIQYILLHELAHVLSIGANIHPSWTLEPKEVTSTREFPYFELSWAVSGDKYASIFDSEFTRRKDVIFYFGPRLEAEAMPATYAALELTSFPTLYAATHPADDFAEAFANYVHVVLMKKPFEIRIAHDGRVVKTYTACWSEPRCARKKAFLERFLDK